MDGQRFDRLTLQLGQALSRRRLGAIVAALGFGAGLGLQEESAAKKKKGKKKKQCKKGTVKCGSKCVNTKTSSAHCGGCKRPCEDGAGCDRGVCQESCPSPKTLCGNDCVDTDTDPDHCGECDLACDQGVTCSGGVCDDDDDLTCTSQAECGGDNGDLRCQNNRCVCNPNGKTGWGICERFADGAGLCGPCCPGATVAKPCPGETVCVNQTMQACDCPPPLVGCPGKAICSVDLKRDSERRGQNCEDCTATGQTCCPNVFGSSGNCVNLQGCRPGNLSSNCYFDECGTCGHRCESGFICCDRDGPTGECLPGGAIGCPPLT